MTIFPPTRAAGLDRLDAFLPRAGLAYARSRNFDRPGHPEVSGLSPYIRHRLVTETEVLQAVVASHGARAAEKFIQEVYWRTYWKGWLEMRPSVWLTYRAGLEAARNRLATEAGLRADWEAACTGRTGIDCFDHWAREIVQTGYLHNHARMWAASIWIFTLRLPWELGADWFLRHLIDGDPASNTLGWRWVGGLQTPGKTYLARADNIARYTDGRFQPRGLATEAPPLDGPPNPPAGPLPAGDPVDRTRPTGLLLHEEDLCLDWLLDRAPPIAATARRHHVIGRSPLQVARPVRDFTTGALEDAAARHSDRLGAVSQPESLTNWAQGHGLSQIVTAHPPVGPAADALAGEKPALEAAGIRVARLIRPEDGAAWPHATRGFFKFKEKIPRLLAALPDRPRAA